MTPLFIRSLAASACVSLLASAALAQPPAPPGAEGWRGQDRQNVHAMMERRREAMGRDLHAVLNIRPDQEAAFAAFEAAMTPPDRGARQRGRPSEGAMTTPQRVDVMLARLDERVAEARRRAAATKAFYAALSPEQQTALDALGRLHGHGRWGGGSRAEHGWGGRQGGDGGWGGQGRPPAPGPGE